MMYTFCEAQTLKYVIMEKFSYELSDRNSASMVPWLSIYTQQSSVTRIHSLITPYDTGMRNQKVKSSLAKKQESHQLP